MVYIENHNGIFDRIVHLVERERKPKKAKVLLLWHDETENIKYYQDLGKKVIVSEHGAGSGYDYANTGHKLTADKILLWGTRSYEAMRKEGYNGELVLTGCPSVEGLDSNRVIHEGLNILFVPSRGRQNKDEFEKENLIVLDELNKTPYNIISKLLQCQDPKKYGENIKTSQMDDHDHLSRIWSILRYTDIVVANQNSTLLAFAMYFNIPVIIVKQDIYDTAWTNTGADYIDLKDLQEAIKLTARFPDRLKDERQQELMLSLGVGLEGSPTDKILKELEWQTKV